MATFYRPIGATCEQGHQTPCLVMRPLPRRRKNSGNRDLGVCRDTNLTLSLQWLTGGKQRPVKFRGDNDLNGGFTTTAASRLVCLFGFFFFFAAALQDTSLQSQSLKSVLLPEPGNTCKYLQIPRNGCKTAARFCSCKNKVVTAKCTFEAAVNKRALCSKLMKLFDCGSDRQWWITVTDLSVTRNVTIMYTKADL